MSEVGNSNSKKVRDSKAEDDTCPDCKRSDCNCPESEED